MTIEQNERRRFLRVECAFPIKYRMVAEEEYRQVRDQLELEYEAKYAQMKYIEEIMNREYGEKGVFNDNPLMPLLYTINQKLDLIMKKLDNPICVNLSEITPPIEMSGVGISFLSSSKIESDSFMYMEFELPLAFSFRAELLAKVQRSALRSDGKWDIAIEYIDLPEFVKERIIRYTLQRERELIRKERSRKY